MNTLLFLINKYVNLLYLHKYLKELFIVSIKHLLLDFIYTTFINNIIIIIIS